MPRKSLEKLFEEIDYSNKVEKYEKYGYKIADKYMKKLGKNTIDEVEEIKMFLAKFHWEIFSQGSTFFSEKSEKEFRISYANAILLLEKIYPFKDDPPMFLDTFRRYSQPILKYSYKTACEVTDIMQTGREGGVYHILKSLVLLNAEYIVEFFIISDVNKYLKDITFDEGIEISREYLKKYGEYLPKKYKGPEQYRFPVISAILKEVLMEHPKMMHRMKYSIIKKKCKDTKQNIE
ncbi:hypothetical protein ACFLS9_09110 [Bacteroidota bacterium]